MCRYVLPDDGSVIGLAITHFLLERMMEIEHLTGREEDAFLAHSRALDELCGGETTDSEDGLGLQ